MENLPKELIYELFNYLDIIDIIKLRLVSHSLYHSINNIPLNIIKNILKPKCFKYLRTYNPGETELKFINIWNVMIYYDNKKINSRYHIINVLKKLIDTAFLIKNHYTKTIIETEHGDEVKTFKIKLKNVKSVFDLSVFNNIDKLTISGVNLDKLKIPCNLRELKIEDSFIGYLNLDPNEEILRDTDFPHNMSPLIISLTIINSKINEIKPYYNIRSLYLNNCKEMHEQHETNGLSTIYKDINDLTIINCDISDISFVKLSRSLYHLDLSYNKIENIEPMHNFYELVILNLSHNQINDISKLNMKCSHIYLSHNKITDIKSLSLINPYTINISNNLISDISSLNLTRYCNKLDLSYNLLSSFNFNNIKYVRNLNISGNKLSGVLNIYNPEELSTLKRENLCREIDLSFNKISDYTCLNDLKIVVKNYHGNK